MAALTDHYLAIWNDGEGADRKPVALVTCRNGEIRLLSTSPRWIDTLSAIVAAPDPRAQQVAGWWRTHVPTGLPLCSVAQRLMSYVPTDAWPIAGHEDELASIEQTLADAPIDRIIGTAIAKT